MHTYIGLLYMDTYIWTPTTHVFPYNKMCSLTIECVLLRHAEEHGGLYGLGGDGLGVGLVCVRPVGDQARAIECVLL